jgi:two-component system response regulator ResD
LVYIFNNDDFSLKVVNDVEKDKLLIIEDELDMRYLLRTHLGDHYDVEEATSGAEGLRMLQGQAFSLVILDIMMEGMDGWDVCKAIRESGNSIPIIMLTARADVKEKVKGLNLGADDYVVKPFDPDELIARCEALLRRLSTSEENKKEPSNIIHVKELTINQNTREVHVGSTAIELTMKEFELLSLLATKPNWAFTRDMLLGKIWDNTKILDFRTVDSHVKNIREKLKKAKLSFSPIQTIWGIGYKFSLPDDAE